MSSQYVRFKWEDEQQEAFEKIKTDMINATYLTMPSWTKPFIIFADASEVAVGSVLAQIADDDESFNFIAFASKKFSDQQKNWSATEKELYAIVWSCERFDGFIKGQPILIYTDHKSLENLTSIDSPKTRRWAIRLSEYRPHVTHIGGDVNILADWLSRSVGDDIDVPDYIYVPECYHVVHELASQFRLPDPQSFIVEAQKEVASLPTGTCMIEEGGTVRGIKSKKLFIPTVYREQILRWFHASRFGGHQGIHRTYNKLKKYVWWPKMFSTVQSFVSSCPICNAIKPIRKQSGEKDVFKRAQLFEIVALDHIGPRRYQDVSYYILVMIDHYSRFMVAVTSTSCSAQTTLDDFKLHWIAKFGVPKIILTDHGTAFTSTIFRDYVLKELRTQHIMSSIEYPQGNAINESSHRLLEVAIRASPVSSKLPFHELVMDATLLHNATPHSMLGDTPSSLMFGVDLRIPGLQQYEDQVEESARLATMSTYRGIRALQNQLKELQKMAEQNQISTIGPRAYLVGDIVIYALGATEASRASHHSGAIKYAAVNSFPHRVLKVLPHNLEVQPIWTEGASRVVPTTQCRLIASFKPDLLREDAAQLFPGLPWISTVPTSSTVPAPVVLPREALLPAEDEEMVPVEPPQRRSKRQRRQTDRGPVLG